jgi:putative chitinase
MLTIEQLQKIIPNNTNLDSWLRALNDKMALYEINTDQRVAAFLAQCMHESNNFNVLKENLNYSTQGLMKTWPSRFPDEDTANAYAHNPEKIANKAYENRMGNGPESSGDGWKFSGKGLIQLTGRTNCEEFAKYIGMDVNVLGDYLLTPNGAVDSACYFFKKNGLNEIADTGDIDKISRIVNGGILGMAERHANYTDALGVLSTV